MSHFTLFKFYGIDWAGMIFLMTSIYLLGKKKRSGFIFGLLGCVSWLAFGVLVGSVADIIANIICIVLHIIGLLRWSKGSGRLLPTF